MKKFLSPLIASAFVFAPPSASAKEPMLQDPEKMEAVVKEIYEATQNTILEGCNFVFSGGRSYEPGTENARIVNLGYSHIGCTNPNPFEGKNKERAELIRYNITRRILQPLVIKLDDDLNGKCFQVDNWQDPNVATIHLTPCEEGQAVS